MTHNAHCNSDALTSVAYNAKLPTAIDNPCNPSHVKPLSLLCFVRLGLSAQQPNNIHLV